MSQHSPSSAATLLTPPSSSSQSSNAPFNYNSPPGSDDGQKSYSFTSFVGALSGVKNIMTGLSSSATSQTSSGKLPLTPQAQKHMKSLTNIFDKLKIQTPETHLGLLLAYSDTLIAPIANHSDIEFNWMRVENSNQIITPILNTGNSLNNGWYAPCADDIGRIIRMRCVDSHDYGVVREIDSEIIQADDDLIERVEDAIYKDRMTSKIILSSTPENTSNSQHNHQKMGTTSVLSTFEIGGSIEIGSKGILICEKGVDHCGLRFYSSPMIEVSCYQTNSFILRFPFMKDKSKTVISWAGKKEGVLHSVLEKYLCPVESTPLLNTNDAKEYLEIIVQCRDRLIRDTLVLSIRCMPAYLTTDPSNVEASQRERMSILPWFENEKQEEDVFTIENSQMRSENIQSLMLELKETQENLQKEKELNEELKSSSQLQEFNDLGSPTSTLDTRSLSCNDLSTLLPMKKTIQMTNSILSMPLRQREVSGYTTESIVDDTSPRPLSGEFNLISTLKNEISSLKDKCERLDLENKRLQAENERYQRDQYHRSQNQEISSSSPSPPTDVITLDIQQLFSEVEQLFRPPSQQQQQQQQQAPIKDEFNHNNDHDSELSGTDSSEHSQEQIDLVESQKLLIHNIENLFMKLHDKFTELNQIKSNSIVDHVTSRTIDENIALLDRNQHLSSQYEIISKEIETIRSQSELKYQQQEQFHQEKMTELMTFHQNKFLEYQNQLTHLETWNTSLQQEKQNLIEVNNQIKEEVLQSTSLLQSLRGEITSLSNYNSEIISELNYLKEKHSNLEQRNHDLQQEILDVSDSKQSLIKQINASDTFRKQINQMKSQMNSLTHELQSVNQLLIEKHNEIEKLNSLTLLLQNDLDCQKKLNEKSTLHLNEIKERNETLENQIQGIENNKNSLIKENNRLRNTINQLSREKKKLDEIEPLYQQQLTVLANIHSKTTELEILLSREQQIKNEHVLTIVSYEMRCGILERKYRTMVEQYHRISMISEDGMGRIRQLEDNLEEKNYKIKLLKQDLNLSKQVEPFVVKKLNYLLSKLHGEKNHFEKKAKSLSRDLQKRLLEGTPLQRELGRVTARLEELENERNAYRDAMVLVCDTYAGREEAGSWFLY